MREAWSSISATSPCTSGLPRRELGQHAAEPERVLDERRAHPLLALRRRVALVEDQVDRPRARRGAARRAPRPRAPRTAPRTSVSVFLAREIRCPIVRGSTRNARAISSVLRPPTIRRVSATRASRESAGWQQVKTSARTSSPIPSSHGGRHPGRHDDAEVAGDDLRLVLQPRVAPHEVDRAVLRRGHQPGARVVRDARPRPRLERGDQRLLRQVLREPDVAHHAGQSGDDPGRLHPPDGVDRTMRVGRAHSAPVLLLGLSRAAARPARAARA